MCGIAAIINCGSQLLLSEQENRMRLYAMLASIRYRGDPEHFGESWVTRQAALGTNRLAIVDRENAQQPVTDSTGRLRVIFNGEIYNFTSLRAELEDAGHEFCTESDTEVLVYGYFEWGEQLPEKLDGIFSFIVYDQEAATFLAARDHIGVKPLYYTKVADTYYFGSEQKCLLPYSSEIHTLPPGHFMRPGRTSRYFELENSTFTVGVDENNQAAAAASAARCRELLDNAVRKQVNTDLPLAVMFSGGIDSTVILHLARKHHPNVTAFTIGFEGAADIAVARRFCEEHGIPQHVYHLQRSELIEALPRVIYESEFFEGIDAMDACVAYFGYRLVRERGFKVALCGEGSDEVLAGYDLFREHPNQHELLEYRVNNLHRTDLQRVDRASMMNSVETRVPFMDRDFLRFAYHLPMAWKLVNGTEKWILREAFRNQLPAYIVERSKVRMPDGSGLKDTLMTYANQHVELEDNVRAALPLDTPQAAYFLKQYIDAGFPVPAERHRRVGYDYSPSGYFEFVS